MAFCSIANRHRYDEHNQFTMVTEICSPEKSLANIEIAEDEMGGPLCFFTGARAVQPKRSNPIFRPKNEAP